MFPSSSIIYPAKWLRFATLQQVARIRPGYTFSRLLSPNPGLTSNSVETLCVYAIMPLFKTMKNIDDFPLVWKRKEPRTPAGKASRRFRGGIAGHYKEPGNPRIRRRSRQSRAWRSFTHLVSLRSRDLLKRLSTKTYDYPEYASME